MHLIYICWDSSPSEIYEANKRNKYSLTEQVPTFSDILFVEAEFECTSALLGGIASQHD